MSNGTGIGTELFRLLPAVYRGRDNSLRGTDGTVTEPGDLACYLDACGVLLDRIKASLDQRLADAFPDNAPDGELSCQEWLLPYFADLLDVRLVSPEAEGQRDEIASAVAWRQGRGTLTVAEAVTEAVGQFEAEIQEGWRRVALTARIGMPLLPATALGEPDDIDVSTTPPSRVALEPGLPAVTVDLRRASRAVQTAATNPVAKSTSFGSRREVWRLANSHGAPCFPGSYEDASRRTVDFRDVDWRRGHYHPRRLLLYVPPPPGFFDSASVSVPWSDRDDEQHAAHFETEQFMRGSERVVVFRGLGSALVSIDGPVTLVSGPGAGADVYRFENLFVEGSVDAGESRVEVSHCAVRQISFIGVDAANPVLQARSTLFGSVDVPGLARLEYCTVLGALAAGALQASDCIFVGGLAQVLSSPLSDGMASCIRFSRVPADNADFDSATYAPSCTSEQAVFYTDVFGARGCAVLHPGGTQRICIGAEDGGEMGAFHDRRYCLRWMAVHDKLGDFLPVGQIDTLIPDVRLLCAPPDAAD